MDGFGRATPELLEELEVERGDCCGLAAVDMMGRSSMRHAGLADEVKLES